ncbi:MAG: BamA/OMP85 family outer membrane protein [Candidatus Kryptoniota bacterium]
MLQKIKSLYYSRGYLLFHVDSIKIDSAGNYERRTLKLYINEGPQMTVGKILFSGNKVFKAAELYEMMDTHVGEPLNQHLLENDIKRILKRYDDYGYALTKISIDSIYLYGKDDHDSIGIAIQIQEGDRIKINAFKIEGNTTTRDYVIIRAISIPKGTYYSNKLLSRAKERLNNLGFFEKVDYVRLFKEGDTTGILVKVTEGNTNTFDGIIGYVPPQADQKGYFTGAVDISMRNLFGTGRMFGAKWHQETRLTQELQISYMEPYIFGLPLNVSFAFNQREQDTTSITRNFKIGGAFIFNDNLTANLNFEQTSVTPLINSFNNYLVFQSTTTNLGLGGTYDTRNDIYNPTYGALYETQFKFGRKTIYGPPSLITTLAQNSVYIQHFTIDLSMYHEIFHRQVAAISVHAAQVIGNELDQTDLYRIGGTNTIRGYLERQFIASRATWTNLEYRYITEQRSYIFAFLDAGYIMRPADPIAHIPQKQFFLYGYGIGAQIETGFGILKASFALARGESFTEGKIHFGIINQF